MEIDESECGQEFISIVRQLPNPILLDFGCGGGVRLVRFLENCQHLRAVGIDISLERIKRAVRYVDEKGMKERVDFIHGDVRFIPFKNNAFSCGLSINVLYILPSLASISELHRILKEGGLVLIAEKTFNPLVARALYPVVNNLTVVSLINKLGNGSFYGNYHLTLNLLRRALLRAKFDIVKEEPNYDIPVPKSLFNVFPRRISNFFLMISNCLENCITHTPILNKLNIGWTLLCDSS